VKEIVGCDLHTIALLTSPEAHNIIRPAIKHSLNKTNNALHYPLLLFLSASVSAAANEDQRSHKLPPPPPRFERAAGDSRGKSAAKLNS
jgi:hypothetical protein